MGRNDDTPTFTRKAARVQTSDDRALASASRRAPAPPAGVPVMSDGPDETTNPFDLFEPQRLARHHHRRGDSAVELAAKLRAERPDPYDLIATMAYELTASKQEARSELDAKLVAFLDVQPGGPRFDALAAAVAELAPVRRGLRWLQASVVIVVLGIGTWLYQRGGTETATAMRIEALEKLTAKLEALAWPAPKSGGTP